MGPVGVPEMVVIFLVALVLFGPKKLPELGRTLGKAISEFRRAQSELKATFDREMQNLERETESLKEIGGSSSYRYDNYNYDYSTSDAGTYGEPYGSSTTEPQDSTVTNTSTISASATDGAESLSPVLPEGAIAHQMESSTEVAVVLAHDPAPHAGGESQSWSLEKELEAQHPANGSAATDHNA
jgi:sec-independent protein translocase protein TatA